MSSHATWQEMFGQGRLSPLWTDPGQKCGISVRKLISSWGEEEKSAGREWMVEQSPKILLSEEKATTTISMMVHHHLSVYHVKVLNGIFKGKATVSSVYPVSCNPRIICYQTWYVGVSLVQVLKDLITVTQAKNKVFQSFKLNPVKWLFHMLWTVEAVNSKPGVLVCQSQTQAHWLP